MIDISFNKLYSYSSNAQSLSKFGMPAFSTLGIVYVIGQYVILQFVKNKSKQIITKKRLHLNVIHRTVFLIQYGLAALIVFFILEMITTSAYSTVPSYYNHWNQLYFIYDYVRFTGKALLFLV